MMNNSVENLNLKFSDDGRRKTSTPQSPAECHDVSHWPEMDRAARMFAAAVKLTVVAGEKLTVGSRVWPPAASMAPGR